MSVWASGVWAAGVWADGVWFGMGGAAPAQPEAQTSSGGPDDDVIRYWNYRRWREQLKRQEQARERRKVREAQQVIREATVEAKAAVAAIVQPYAAKLPEAPRIEYNWPSLLKDEAAMQSLRAIVRDAVKRRQVEQDDEAAALLLILTAAH